MADKFWDKLMDQVRLIALLRFDLIDARAITGLTQDAIQEALGAIIGPNSGCTSAVINGWSNDGAGTYYLTFPAPFQFYYAFAARRRADDSLLKAPDYPAAVMGDALQKVYRGVVVTFDPQNSGQTVQIDITALRAQALTVWDAYIGSVEEIPWNDTVRPYLWARPVAVSMDLDARRVWNALDSQEDAVSINTRDRVRVEFRLQYSDPNTGAADEAPWVRIARVLLYNGAADKPILYPISFMDDPDIMEFGEEPGHAGFADGAQVGAEGDETGAETTFGYPPVPGNTSGVSVFLSPRPPEDFDVAGLQAVHPSNPIPNKGRFNPPGFGLVQGLGLVRNRFLRSLTGASDERRWKKPWWNLPQRGLDELSDLIDAANAQITSILATLATLNRILAWGWGTRTGSATWAWTKQRGFTGVPTVVPADGTVECSLGRLTPNNAAPGAVLVTAYGLGTSGGYFDAAKGGYRAAVKSVDGTVGLPISWKVYVILEGPAHGMGSFDGTMVAVEGDFFIVVLEDDSA